MGIQGRLEKSGAIILVHQSVGHGLVELIAQVAETVMKTAQRVGETTPADIGGERPVIVLGQRRIGRDLMSRQDANRVHVGVEPIFGREPLGKRLVKQSADPEIGRPGVGAIGV